LGISLLARLWDSLPLSHHNLQCNGGVAIFRVGTDHCCEQFGDCHLIKTSENGRINLSMCDTLFTAFIKVHDGRNSSSKITS